jgi:hypothetical protein
MKREMGVDGILNQWEISRAKFYKMKSKINESLASSDGSDKILNLEKVEHSMLEPLENMDIPVQSQLSKTQTEQKFSFAINMVGSLSPLTSTLQLLAQSNLIPSSNMQISVQIEEI